MLALSLDTAGPAGLAAAFTDANLADQGELLENVWRLDHPRLLEILDTPGAALPDKAMAKRARRCAVKLRTRLGQQNGRGI